MAMIESAALDLRIRFMNTKELPGLYRWAGRHGLAVQLEEDKVLRIYGRPLKEGAIGTFEEVVQAVKFGNELSEFS